jgi:TDG/mug DNA glycosylase family protein
MEVLPDVLKSGLKVIFCGTAVGTKSAQVGAYYAGVGNQFWDILYKTGLTPYRLDPLEFQSLLNFGIGLTDLAKRKSGTDENISSSDFDIENFKSKIIKHSPKALAFNGKRAVKNFLGHAVEYGRQVEQIGKTIIFVLPSTSGAAHGYWDESFWIELAEFVNK